MCCAGHPAFFRRSRRTRHSSRGIRTYVLRSETPNTLTAWIAISEASIAAGCMRFLPGSHNKGIYGHDEAEGEGQSAFAWADRERH